MTKGQRRNAAPEEKMLAILELPDQGSLIQLKQGGVQTTSTTTSMAPAEPPPSPDSRSMSCALPRHDRRLRVPVCTASPPARVPARPPGRTGAMEIILSRSTDYTDYTSPQRHACTRIAAHTAFTAARTPPNPAALHQYASAERHITPRVADDAGISLG